MSKLCALVIGHKERSPGVKSTEAHLIELDFDQDLPFKISLLRTFIS